MLISFLFSLVYLLFNLVYLLFHLFYYLKCYQFCNYYSMHLYINSNLNLLYIFIILTYIINSIILHYHLDNNYHNLLFLFLSYYSI